MSAAAKKKKASPKKGKRGSAKKDTKTSCPNGRGGAGTSPGPAVFALASRVVLISLAVYFLAVVTLELLQLNDLVSLRLRRVIGEGGVFVGRVAVASLGVGSFALPVLFFLWYRQRCRGRGIRLNDILSIGVTSCAAAMAATSLEAALGRGSLSLGGQIGAGVYRLFGPFAGWLGLLILGFAVCGQLYGSAFGQLIKHLTAPIRPVAAWVVARFLDLLRLVWGMGGRVVAFLKAGVLQLIKSPGTLFRRRKNITTTSPPLAVTKPRPLPARPVSTPAATSGLSLPFVSGLARKPAKKPTRVSPEPRRYDKDYSPPSLDLLRSGSGENLAENQRVAEQHVALLTQRSGDLTENLASFNIVGDVVEVHPGPLVTTYEFRPATGTKVGKITSLQDELAMGLKAESVRIIAPIPGKDTVGIEVPNVRRDIVRLRDILESEDFTTNSSSLTIAVGRDSYGTPVSLNVATMPHLLIAGATGTGKSVCINTILMSFLQKASPDELGLILIDPKILELSVYDDIPHLRVPVVTDCRKAKGVLSWAVAEMERRYRLMQRHGVRSIDSYNHIAFGEQDLEEEPGEEPGVALEDGRGKTLEEDEVRDTLFQEPMKPLPKIVIVIDELADLMFQVGREVEELITRLAQKARAAGIHLIVATQRPSVDVVTGLIKANFPARMSFRVSSRIDSRTILDSMGAERLLGRGDMLLMTPGAGPLKRVHGAFVSDKEVADSVAELKANEKPRYDPKIVEACDRALAEDSSKGGGADGEDFFDEKYDEAVNFVIAKGEASTSLIQRTLQVGYNRAARILEMMEREGIVGPMNGVKRREVLVGSRDQA